MKTLKEAVTESSIVEGKCRLWQKKLRHETRPIAVTQDGYGAYKQIDLHLFLARKKFNIPEGKYIRVKTTCGHANCINPDHIELDNIKRSVFVNRRNSKRSNARNNMMVFSLAVTESLAFIAKKLKMNRGTIAAMLDNNTAMLPYFQLKIQAHLGDVSIAELRQTGATESQLQEYGLAPHAISYILSEQNYYIVDEDLYVNLISECEVLGDHLVWCGKVVNGAAVSNALNSRFEHAAKLFYYCATRIKPLYIPTCNCGHKDCINPFHLE